MYGYFSIFVIMRHMLYILTLYLLSVTTVSAQETTGRQPYGRARAVVVDGEEIYEFRLMTVRCTPRPRDMSRYYRTVMNVRKVYPLAREAERLLAEIEASVQTMDDPKAQRKYIRQMEKDLIEQYTPVLKNMTFSQGKILIKLLDRQTSHTGYALIRELRGGFRAGIYQGIGKIFGMNLKDTYDAEGEDKIIEEIIEMYEQGLI